MVNGWTLKWRKMQDVNRDRRDENAMEGNKKVPFICFKTCELKTKLGALCVFLRNDCDIMMSAHDYSYYSNAAVFLKFNKQNFLMIKNDQTNFFLIKF